jgi:hypothetical protein
LRRFPHGPCADEFGCLPRAAKRSGRSQKVAKHWSMRMVPSIIMTLADMCSGVPVMALGI